MSCKNGRKRKAFREGAFSPGEPQEDPRLDVELESRGESTSFWSEKYDDRTGFPTYIPA